MYCDKDNVNQLTAQLIAAGISDIVVCPGSRNAVLTHNFHEAARQLGAFRLYPVTDERCAAFFAIGVWIETRRPVAVCVTSGSALLNTLPGVAEAYYRKIPLVIISADRPPQWIDQLDGQTIRQPGALAHYAVYAEMDEHPDFISTTAYNPRKPLHINVPLSEPLFSFTTPELPPVRASHFEQWLPHNDNLEQLDIVAGMVNDARLPAVIVGQYEGRAIPSLVRLDADNKLLLLPEVISNHPLSERSTWIESLKAQGMEMPDVVLHMGGAMVNKWLKLRLRQLDEDELRVVRIDEEGEWADTFSHLDTVVECEPARFFHLLEPLLKANAHVAEYKKQFAPLPHPQTVKEKAMAALWQALDTPRHQDAVLFVGNSAAVRVAARTIPSGSKPIYCNRGVNGIEGSLSVSVGHAVASDRETFVVVGDHSFFYDSIALWTTPAGGNLRKVVLNDHHGGIFDDLPGLSASPALDELIAARHNSTAEGIALSYGCNYKWVSNIQDYNLALNDMLNNNDNKPYIIEYDTNME